jgi:hypothetical protein
MSDTPTHLPFYLGNAGEAVVEVDPDDLKTMWQKMRDLQARHPGASAVAGGFQGTPIGEPDAHSGAVWFRTTMLSTLYRVAREPLAPWMNDEEVADAVFRTMARIPMEWIGFTPRAGLPFDVDEFFRQLTTATEPGEEQK